MDCDDGVEWGPWGKRDPWVGAGSEPTGGKMTRHEPCAVVEVRASVCRVPLVRPIRLSGLTLRSREYLVVRLVTADGTVGEAVGPALGRLSLPPIEALARRLMGRGVAERRRFQADVLNGQTYGRVALLPALGLLDVCMWDADAKQNGVPVHALLGTMRTTVPVIPIGGFFPDEVGVEGVRAEVASYAEAGHDMVKIGVHVTGSPDPVVEYVRVVNEAAPGHLALDFHGAWRTSRDAARVCQRLDDLQLCFIEDPISVPSLEAVERLASRLRTPVATGESLTEPWELVRLTDSVDVLRLTTSLCGGLTIARDLVEVAAARAREVIPHVFAPYNSHLAAASHTVTAVEIIDPTADPANHIFATAPKLRDGHLLLDDSPGFAAPLDWEFVDRHTVASLVTRPQ